MKSKTIVLSLILGVGGGGWLATTLAQRNTPFNVPETRKQLEILEGILSTTLKYAAGESRATRGRAAIGWGRGSGIEGFYLYGQGAVFIVPNSHSGGNSRLPDLDRIENLIDQIEEKGSSTDVYLRTLERRLHSRSPGLGDFLYVGGEGLTFELAEPPLPPPAPPVPPVSVAPNTGRGNRAPGAQSEEERKAYADRIEALTLAAVRNGKPVSGEELKEWIRTQRADLKELRQQAEQEEQERAERERKIEDALISALAQHGDSLSALKPEEYVSLIFLTGSAGLEDFIIVSENRNGALVVAVQMSHLTEFRRGGLTLAQLRERLVRYEL